MPNKDQKLLSCLKESDKNSFRDLFSKYHQSLFNFVLYRLKDEVIADDIVQETFLRVWKHRNSIKPNQSFFSYIAKISNNLCMDYFRHENVKLRHQEHIPQLTQSGADNPAIQYESKILEDKIHSIVNNSLPKKCREIFILSRVNGLANKEIAELLEVSRRTVENQLYRALKVLRSKLKDYL